MEKILIANRAEIARRICRTARKMGIATVAVYNAEDRGAPHSLEADEAFLLPGDSLAETYLNTEAILEAARRSGADAIHPGYGFLSENHRFAARCEEEGLRFIGPPPAAIEAMGSKSRAKEIMQTRKIPLIPGYNGKEQEEDHLLEEAAKIGYPLLIKASAGGGGKGMVIVGEEQGFREALARAKREAKSSFGDERVLLERYFPHIRHIEIQVLGDQHGKLLYLLERECSIQRRYQKIIEECPSPFLDEALREKMGRAAVEAARAIGYYNAGTVEFLVSPEKEFFFLEMNTRLQVEHPVTEVVTGIDLVEWQIRIARGEKLSFDQGDIAIRGHAIECRLYAEDPANDFLPSTGEIRSWKVPDLPYLRVDAGIEEGNKIGVHFDPMIAKIICSAGNRRDAIRRMQLSLQRLQCMGLQTNQQFLSRIMASDGFREGETTTQFIDQHRDFLLNDADTALLAPSLIAFVLWDWALREKQRSLLASLPSGWRNNRYQDQKIQLKTVSGVTIVSYRYEKDHLLRFHIGDEPYEVLLLEAQLGGVVFEMNEALFRFAVCQNGKEYELRHQSGFTTRIQVEDPLEQQEVESEEGSYTAPMPGQVVKVLVSAGEEVKPGDPLLLIHSMKMENTIKAHEEGEVREIYVVEGQFIESGARMLHIERKNNQA